MIKNTAGQSIGIQAITAADGTAFTGTVTVAVTVDNGTQATGTVGSGTCTHEGNGYHSYAPSQAETNGDHVAYTFTGSGMIPATVQVFPVTLADYMADLTSLNDLSAAEVNAEVDTALADYDAVVPADLPTNFGDLAVTVTTGLVTAGTVNDKTGYSISGTKNTLDDLNDVTAAQVRTQADDALAAYDPPTKAELDSGLAALNDPTAATIADAVWDEATAGHATAGSTGKALSDILADTNELQGDWTDGGRLDLLIDAILADTGTDGVAISSATANEIADAILKRDWSEVSGESARSALNALRAIRNKVSVASGTMTVTKEDDSTSAWTAAVTSNASADPITEVDPA